MKWVAFLAALLLVAFGCRGKRSPSEPRRAYSYREVLHWEIPPNRDGQPHGLQGVAIGPSGEVFVADTEGRRIVVSSADGRVLREIRPPRKGSNLLQMPFALLHDGKGRLYVTDYAADQVQVFSLDGKFLFAWGREGFRPGEFRSPVGIAQDPVGNLYVVEFYNHRVQKFTAEGKFLLMWGEEGDWNKPDEPPEKMLYPAGIDVGPDGNVYVADSGRDKIKVFSPEGKFLRQFGAKGPEPGKFNALAGVSFDAMGRLHEADSAAHRVQMFSKEGVFLAAWPLPDAGRLVIWSPSRILAYQDRFLFVSDVATGRIYKLQIEEEKTR
ncbi:MAG: NHL repeat-containing protein [Acidobacteria bacterium]|nr:NHL repeat-containing protein [Acidobacteriota bacterium]